MVIQQNPALPKIIDQQHKAKLLKLVSIAAVFIAVILVIIKSIAWFKTDSVALLGSLLDSVLDTAAALINMYFIHSALQPADVEHRFGHGKAEPIGGMFQAMIIGGSALFLVAEAVRRLFNPEVPEHSQLGITVMLISSLLVAALWILQRHVIKQTGSMIVTADALHGFGDITINLSVVASLLLSSQFNAPIIDPLVALLLAGILIRGAWQIGKTSIDQLMDTEFSEQERNNIRQLAIQHPKVKDIHDLRTRKAGLSAFIQLHLELDGNLNLTEAHQITDDVELSIRSAFPHAEVFIHQDPFGKEDVDPFLRS